MAENERQASGALRRRERRAFLVGAFAILLTAALLARYHVSSVDSQYQPDQLPGLRVNVNTANQATLALLDQIGPERARLIVEFRETNGPFRTYPDLLRVRGIGRRTVEGLVDRICFEDQPR